MQPWLKPPVTPLILDDAGTVAHVWWKGGALADLKGNVWTMNGTVPQIAKAGRTPAGAGPLSDANYYSLGTGSDVLDLAEFTLTLVVEPPAAFTVQECPFSNGQNAVGGYYVQVASTVTKTVAMATYSGSLVGIATGNGLLSGVNALTVGRAAGTSYIKLNGGTTASVVAAMAAGTGVVARLGRYAGVNLPWSGKVYELAGTSTPFNEAAAAAIHSRVRSKTGVTAW